jgi:hypothetical protein
MGTRACRAFALSQLSQGAAAADNQTYQLYLLRNRYCERKRHDVVYRRQRIAKTKFGRHWLMCVGGYCPACIQWRNRRK